MLTTNQYRERHFATSRQQNFTGTTTEETPQYTPLRGTKFVA